MGNLFLSVFILSAIFSFEAFGLSLDEKMELAKERCAPYQESDASLLLSEFGGGQTPESMDALYEKVYNMEGRLPERVGYYPGKGFVSQIDTPEQGDFPEDYIKSVILHVENLIRLNYVKHVFYSDMGHSHFFIPAEYYQENIYGRSYRATKSASIAMKSKGLKTLYHTAEQLQVRDNKEELLVDQYLQWRFYTRNPVVDRDGHTEILTDFSGSGNTVRDYFPAESEYSYFSGFYISANKGACFPFEGKSGDISYFDLSFSAPKYVPGEDDLGLYKVSPSWPSNWQTLSAPKKDWLLEYMKGDLINH